MIEEYNFGYIIIDGKRYDNDIEMRWTNEVLLWSFKEKHLIGIEEVKRAVGQAPETIIIGTGKSGLANVTKEAQNFIKNNGIELIIDKTEEAVRTFNIMKEDSLEEEGRQRQVIGLFHLTC
ncbi:hypothetical protein KKE19_02000 [Patescibacteria group bacterium]|nr:hypothetical protein [Patescibacteria group bacterium]MBU4367470.1 hypothetical protein [Patescibacteria group bacterium]MBU4461790.1 hypothetical protein [Patescibacteria group bacterium]MCG2700174.1 MTH938/NDUFAF3 family protein [Candidatus Parcubacteria bacterium]